MENYLTRITINSNQLDGKPCIRGMRISVQTILEFLSAGDVVDDILQNYPMVCTEIRIPLMQGLPSNWFAFIVILVN